MGKLAAPVRADKEMMFTNRQLVALMWLQDMVQITQSHLLAEAVRVKSINQVNRVLCRFNT